MNFKGVNILYNYSTSYPTAEVVAGSMVGYYIVAIIFAVISIVALWKIFTKAGEKGWKAIIPVYNTVVLFKIVGLSPWLLLLMFVPIANLVVAILSNIKLAKAFGKGGGFAVGLIFLGFIFQCILAFGSAEYQKPQEA